MDRESEDEQMIPQKIMEDLGITNEEIVNHWEAQHYLSQTGSEAKLKNISQDFRDKMKKFYSLCRLNGFYPIKPEDGKMTFYKLHKQGE